MEQPFNFKEGAMLEKNLDAKFYRKNKTPWKMQKNQKYLTLHFSTRNLVQF